MLEEFSQWFHRLYHSRVSAQPTEKQIMSFKSILSTIGSDAKKVFAFLGSSKGQQIIAAGEGVLVTVDPGLAGLAGLFNTYAAEALKIEAIATAAGSQSGTGAQKLAAVVAAVTPTALAYAQSAGLAAPTAAEIQNQVTAAVAFVNAINAQPAAPPVV